MVKVVWFVVLVAGLMPGLMLVAPQVMRFWSRVGALVGMRAYAAWASELAAGVERAREDALRVFKEEQGRSK